MVPYTCGIQSTEAECNSSIETKPTLYLQATTTGQHYIYFMTKFFVYETMTIISASQKVINLLSRSFLFLKIELKIDWSCNHTVWIRHFLFRLFSLWCKCTSLFIFTNFKQKYLVKVTIFWETAKLSNLFPAA